jgi:hypothetical protein
MIITFLRAHYNMCIIHASTPIAVLMYSEYPNDDDWWILKNSLPFSAIKTGQTNHPRFRYLIYCQVVKHTNPQPPKMYSWAVFLIRIRQVSGSASGSRRAKITKNRKVNKFHVLKCWMFSFLG